MGPCRTRDAVQYNLQKSGHRVRRAFGEAGGRSAEASRARELPIGDQLGQQGAERGRMHHTVTGRPVDQVQVVAAGSTTQDGVLVG